MYTFRFLNEKNYIYTKKNIWHLAIWQNQCSGQFYHSKIEKDTFSLSQFSLVTGFFEGTRGNIFQIFWAIFNVQAQKFRKLDNLFWHFLYHRMQLGIKVSRTSSSFDVTYCPTSKVLVCSRTIYPSSHYLFTITNHQRISTF